MTIPFQFDAVIDEFLARSRELIGLESSEDRPPRIGPATAGERYANEATPGDCGPDQRIRSLFTLDEDSIRRYARTIGDDNPLFTDPRYGRGSVHGSQIAPGPILVHCRYPADHGASREHGYPLANFIGNVAWEFYDVIRPGTAVTSSKVLREVLEPRGARGGRILLLVCEVIYRDEFGTALAKAYGTLVQVPMKSMGASRAMPLEFVDDSQLYERRPHRYQAGETEAILAGMDGERRRGAEPRYWDEVEVGEVLPPIHQPPYALADALSYQSLHQGLVAGHGGGVLGRSFAPAYRAIKAGWGYPDFSRVHPVTQWPHTPGDEHEDAWLCGFRGQPLPFDFGIQRGQIPQRLIGNWAGDSGFCRKMSMAMGRPLFHGDALTVRGRVIAKKIEREDGSGQAYHCAVVAMDASNQRGESVSRGYASVYLPARGEAAPMLPIPLARTPAYVPYDRHRSQEWF